MYMLLQKEKGPRRTNVTLRTGERYRSASMTIMNDDRFDELHNLRYHTLCVLEFLFHQHPTIVVPQNDQFPDPSLKGGHPFIQLALRHGAA